jgi:hypothetical protein
MADYFGWTYYDDCLVCPVCNDFVSCDGVITDMLDAIDKHKCDPIDESELGGEG